jgi:ketosteroid isomerase-like protein
VNSNGAGYRVPIVHLWQVRGGKIARAEFYVDHPRMLAALAAA